MKRKPFTLLLILIALQMQSFSQVSGTIQFEERMKMILQTEDTDQMGDMAEQMPKELKFYKLLYFTPEQSLYTADKTMKQDSKNMEVDTDNDGPRIIMKMDEPDEQVYCDLLNKKKIEKRDLFDRPFIVESDLSKMEWKLTTKQKTILGYPCQEAVLKDSSINLKVWFTSSLPVSTGPNGFGNLPGLILEVNRDEGKQIITAINISPGEVDEKIFVKPSGGKKMNKEDFNKLVEEKRKEMQEENGGEGNFIIKIRN